MTVKMTRIFSRYWSRDGKKCQTCKDEESDASSDVHVVCSKLITSENWEMQVISLYK